LPARSGGPVSFTITDATHWNPFARSTLTLDGATRMWSDGSPAPIPILGGTRGDRRRFAHKGKLGGIVAQVIAGFASLGGLVWTGIVLGRRGSWRDAW
jgi:uncharacterized iron-regulated membrane protein